MKTNLIFKIYKDTIIISEIKKEVDEKSLNNTNIIDVKDLKFSIEYIKENFDLVSGFLSVILIKNSITTAQINNMDIASISMELINSWEQIKRIIFKPDKKISPDIYFKLLDNKYINYVECYELEDYLLDRIDTNKKIVVKTRHKIENISKFMSDNFMSNYSDIYYKKSIIIEGDINDVDDIKTFMRLNNKLKTIRIIGFSNEIFATVIDAIEENKKENIIIEILQGNNDLDMIYKTLSYFKKKYRDYFEENNIKFKLLYSNDYKKKNYFKEINYKLFSTIATLIILFGTIIFSINYYQQYIDRNKIENQMNDIRNIVIESESESIDDNDPDIEYITPDTNTTTVTTTKKKSTYVSSYYKNYTKVFESLLKINKDTVGWLTVNNTKIDYPVVQTDNNAFYLNHDYNKKKNSMGWIFMDYRNDAKNLSKNTIIYGHNIKQGIMFGTIKNMLSSSWYNKNENLTITFNTPSKNMKWKIFSMYKIDATDDYLNTEFESNEEWMKFVNTLKSRSIKNFNVDVNENSKIITLSTCFSHTTRHVIHAVLIEE